MTKEVGNTYDIHMMTHGVMQTWEKLVLKDVFLALTKWISENRPSSFLSYT